MKTSKFWLYQLIAALPLIVGYLLFIVLLWLLVTLYYLPHAFLMDTIRFSLPLLIIWEAIDCYRASKRVRAIQNGHSISAANPVEAQLIAKYRRQNHMNQQTLRHMTSQQQEQLDRVELYSHEIKNSLTSLQAAAENNSVVPSSAVVTAVRQANNQLNMLLSDERLAITNHDFTFEWVNLETLVTDILKQNSAVFIYQQLIPQLTGLHNVRVLTDRKWLRFCIYQLLSNAIKYSSKGASIDIKWADNSLRIIDHGEGIAASDLPRIYDNGFSGHNGHQTTKSTGMGLYLVKKVTSQLNFGLKVSSKKGQGTTACLQFPADNIRIAGASATN